MPVREVVDLSLSTDDEAPRVNIKAAKAAATGRTDSGYRSLSDRFIDIDDAGPRKRRKLTPPFVADEASHSSTRNKEYTARTTSLPVVKANANVLSVDDDDPIVWTSSPKQKPTASSAWIHKSNAKWTSLSDSDDSLPDEAWLRRAQQRPAQAGKRPQQTTGVDLYGDKTKLKNPVSPYRDKKYSVPSAGSRSKTEDASDSHDTTDGSNTAQKPKGAKGQRSKLTEEEKAARAQEKEEARAAAKAIKAKEKEEERERKRLLKEEQAREKQKERDRAEANKLKLDKKLSTPEMIVDLPISIDGSSVDTQIRECLKNIGVEVTSYQSPVANLIKWRRKVESRFNASTGCREKLPTKAIDPEKHIMYLISANEFVQLATADSNGAGQCLDEHVARIKSAAKGCILIYLIEGLDAWMRKNRNARNRNYQAAVLSQGSAQDQENSTNGSNATSKRRKQRIEIVDENMVEDALLHLQIVNNCLIHHTAASVETAEWVMHFTEQISQIPYRYITSVSRVDLAKLTMSRHEQMARESTFCMESGQVKCGKDAEEIYINMLLANVRVTAPIAFGIEAKYPTVAKLARGLEEKGSLALEHLKVSIDV
ncbi:MAG: hypothetical protein Q9201_001827 [Fulgogasparrea decipioides]